MAVRIKQNPQDAWALARRGEILLHDRKPTEALESLQQANRLGPKDEGVRALLVSTFLSALRQDFARHHAFAPQIEPLIDNEAQRIDYLMMLGAGSQLGGDLAKATEAYVKLAQLAFTSRNVSDAIPFPTVSPADGWSVRLDPTPRQVKRLFSNCRIMGRRFRLAHVYFQDGKIIEVATFRARDLQDDAEDDAPADDILIRDDNVFGTPEEDAARRDFTINALFYDVGAATVLDHADGLGDIRRRVVRTIGDPDVRFREDPIRILRAIKFAARLDFTIEPRTLEALRRLRSEIPKAAPPRVLEEINRFCRGGAARASFDLMFETGVFETVLPELAAAVSDAGSAWLRVRLGQGALTGGTRDHSSKKKKKIKNSRPG